MHIETVTFTATAPGASGAAASAVTGDSLTVKNCRGKARGLAIWAKYQTAGFLQIATPSGHDTTRGLRLDVAAQVNPFLLPPGLPIEFQPQELISATIAGSATAGDVEQASILMFYDDLPGVDARLITSSQLHSRFEEFTSISATITASAGPGYSGEELITSESDLLRANRDYAVLGAVTRAAAHAVTIRGPDLGNVKIALPGDHLHPQLTSRFFVTLSEATGKPTIPVINSGNKAATFIGCHQDENAVAVNVAWILALLK